MSTGYRVAPPPIGAAIAVLALAAGTARSAEELEPARGAAPPRLETELFESDIAPLLARHCLECHDAAAKKGGLDLSRREAALAGGDSGAALVPGEVDASLLWRLVDSGEMPRKRPPLSDDEKRRLRDWIAAGAVWPDGVIEPADPERRRRGEFRWLQRLTVLEYIETVRRALGVDIEHDARRLLPPDVRADGFSNTASNLGVDLAHIEA